MSRRRLATLTRVARVALLGPARLVALIGAVPGCRRAELPAGVAGQWVEVLDTRLRVVQQGSGPHILLLHGSPGSVEDWGPIGDRLAGSFRVTAFDRPGQGHSDARDIVSAADNARVALALCDRLDLRAVTVVGHSYGGAVALAMAIQRPGRIRAYVTVAGAVHHPRREIDLTYRVLALPLLGRGIARIVTPLLGPGQVERGLRQAFQPNLEAMPAGFLEQARRLWLSTRVIVTTARERVGLGVEQERELIPRYAGIRAPLVLVHGDADRLVSARQSREVQRQVPHAELHLLPGVGHYVQFARPDELTQIIRDVAARPATAVDPR